MGSHSVFVVLCIAFSQADPAESAPPKLPPAEAFKKEAAAYDVRLESRPGDKLVIEREPVLHWDNPARTGEDGSVFVWTLDGRPQMIGTIFTYLLNDKINRKHEYHSLALEPLTAKFDGKTVWTPSTAGIKFHPLPEAAAPAGSARLRLTQMKALAREFSASMREPEGEQFQLRLLTQPLFRYEPMSKEVLDGALFAFSLGTDPEVILLLEARRAKEGYQWQYGLARFHYIELHVQHDDKEVWRADALEGISNLNLGVAEFRDSIYTTYHVERGIPVE
jgi:hypothetical protein